jgi:RimJ/RimL family protein N-acetyltransferase
MAQPPSPPTITPARPVHARAYAEHLIEHLAESGREGSAHFAVLTAILPEEVERSALERWSTPLDEPLWSRAWLLWSGEPRARVVGHLDLRGGRVQAELHRAVVGMGILRPFTGHRYGQRLLDAAITWARDEAELSYLDLGVFTNNERARRLYTRMGFVQAGLREDAFRVGEVVLDNIEMTLALRPPGRAKR